MPIGEKEFEARIEPHRRELRAHCYRMLGSWSDAEDLLQEALIRAWRGWDGFEGRSSLRSWLYRIATNACLDELERRPKRMLPKDAAPPATPGAQRSAARSPNPTKGSGPTATRGSPERHAVSAPGRTPIRTKARGSQRRTRASASRAPQRRASSLSSRTSRCDACNRRA